MTQIFVFKYSTLILVRSFNCSLISFHGFYEARESVNTIPQNSKKNVVYIVFYMDFIVNFKMALK